ncbi:MAG: hypothetical protein IIU03_08800 [Bacteroidales bacterium]|nr:hypothetical protein [Bacteroidales bacterium]
MSKIKNNNYDWLWKMFLGASFNLYVQNRRKKLNKKNAWATAGVGALAGLTEDFVSKNVRKGYGFLSGVSSGGVAGSVLGIGNALITDDDILDEGIKFAGSYAAVDGIFRGFKAITMKSQDEESPFTLLRNSNVDTNATFVNNGKSVSEQVYEWYNQNRISVKSKSKIYIWLDKEYCKNVEKLRQQILLAFENTIFKAGYSIVFCDKIIYPTDGYDICVCLTNAAKLSNLVNYRYIDDCGSTQYGVCPNGAYPIWVTPFEELQYILPYCIMHEIGHRIIKFSHAFFAYHNLEKDKIRKYEYFDHDYIKDEKKGYSLMEAGNLVIGNLKSEKSLNAIIDKGYLNINDGYLNKVIITFLLFKSVE